MLPIEGDFGQEKHGESTLASKDCEFGGGKSFSVAESVSQYSNPLTTVIKLPFQLKGSTRPRLKIFDEYRKGVNPLTSKAPTGIPILALPIDTQQMLNYRNFIPVSRCLR